MVEIEKLKERLKEKSESDDDIGNFLEMLYKIVLENPKSEILEFGVSDRGSSTTAFLLGCHEVGGHLTSVDKRSCDNINKIVGDDNHWTFLKMDSKQFTSKKKFDICLIDSEHSYEQVKAECNVLDKVMKKRSIIFFHDTTMMPQITKAINEFMKRHNCFTSKLKEKNGMWAVELDD